MDLVVDIKKLHTDAVIPSYKKTGDAGFDLHSVEEMTILPLSSAVIPTGLAVAVPEGYEMQIRMRSGAALRTSLIIANAPGTIDAGYRGEIGIIVKNVGSEPVTVQKGERIAQGVIAPVIKAVFNHVSELSASDRGDNGFGSTGAH